MSLSSNATRSVITNRIGLRLASAAAAAVLAGAMFTPGSALAAEWISVGEDYYDTAQTFETWGWNGADDMWLNGYNGGSIYAYGNLNVAVTGENTITMTGDDDNYSSIGLGAGTAYERVDVEEWVPVEDGDLTITGSGTLNIQNDGVIENSYYVDGVFAEGDIIVDGATVNVTLEDAVTEANETVGDGSSSSSYGWQTGVSAHSLTLKNGARMTVISSNQGHTVSYDDAEFDIHEVWKSSNATGISLWASTKDTNSLIDDSVLTVAASGDAFKVDSSDYDDTEITANLTIRDSEVVIASTYGQALSVADTLTIQNSDLGAASGEDYFAVTAGKIVLSQESGNTTVASVGSDEYPLYALVTSDFDPDAERDPQTLIELRRTGETPKHLKTTTEATAATTNKDGLAQTGDPFNAALPAGLGAAAVAMLAGAKHLRRREDEE